MCSGCTSSPSTYSNTANESGTAGKVSYPGSQASEYSLEPGVLATTKAGISTTSKNSTPSNIAGSQTAPAAGQVEEIPAGFEVFGEWRVKALHDEMDTETRVYIYTTFHHTPRSPNITWANQYHIRFGMEIVNNSYIVLSPSVPFAGEGYWPQCDYDRISTSVDGAKAIRIATIDDPGFCNSVSKNGEAIRQFKNGTQAKIRMGHMDGTISLNGFKKAWARVAELGK